MRKILAVDDDTVVTEFFMDVLGGAGYEVATAPDATGALMRFRESRPDLVILDVQMPGGGGEQAFDVIRNVLDSGLPVIFVTSLPGRAAGFTTSHTRVRIMAKPVAPEALLACVSGLLGDASRS